MCIQTWHYVECLHVCPLSSSTERIASPSGQAHSEIFGSHPHLRYMVSKRSIVWSCWLFRPDWVDDLVDRKSTSGTFHFLGRSLVCWSSRKQNCVSLSTAEAEYIVVGACCTQLLWMKQTLKDYGIKVKQIPLYCDNESAIKFAHNHVQHSRMKHIAIRHHFICDHVAREDIVINHVKTEDNLADIFTKPLDEKRFYALRCELNILDFTNVQ